jgi:hypothetical protein
MEYIMTGGNIMLLKAVGWSDAVALGFIIAMA